ncbi:MAG: AsmA family protein [Geminicoccaceae bacterium]
MRLLIAAALLVILTVTGLAAIPYVVPWERYRPDIEAGFERLTGQDVTIHGPIDVSLFPRPSLSARDVAISGQTEGQGGFEIQSQQVDIEFRTGPFLVGRPHVDRLRLNRPLLVLDQKASAGLKSWPPQLDTWSKVFFDTDLQLITIDDGRLRFGQEEASEPAAVSNLSLTLARAKSKGPLKAAGLFKTRDHRFTFATELGVPSRDGSSTLKMEIGAKNGIDETTTLKLAGVLRRQGPETGLEGKIDLAGPDLRHGLKAVSFMMDAPPPFLSLAAKQPFSIETRFQATPKLIATEKAQITLNGKLGSGQITLELVPKPNLDLDIDLPILHLADETALNHFVPIDLLSVIPTTPGRIDIRIREMVYREKPIRRTAITIVTDSGGTPRVERAKALLPGLVDVHFEGRLRTSDSGRVLGGKLISAGDELGETLRWLGLPLADQGKGWRGFNLESNITISDVEIALSAIDMRLDTSKIQGKVDLRFSERLMLGLDVDVERLNLDLYMADDGNLIGLTDFLDQQFEQLDSSINARFQRLSWRGLRFEEATFSATIDQKNFKLNSLTLQTTGATEAIIEGEIDLRTEAVDLTTELKSEFPARVLRHLNIKLPLTSARLMPLTLSGWVIGSLDGFDVGLQADYDSGQWSVEGRAGWIEEQAHYDLTINAEHPDHRALAGHFGLAPLVPYDDAPGPFKIDGQLRQHQEGDWIIGGNVKLGPTSITGRLTHQEMTVEKGKWDARISIGNPKQDSLAPFFSLIGHRSTGHWTPRSILGRLPTTAIRTAWLDDADGSLSLVARGGLAGEGINISARLEKGFLYVDKFEADLWNGDLSAEISLERRREQPFASMAIELDDIDAESLTDWLGIPKTIDGLLKLKLEAASVGRTVFDLAKGLAGSIELEMEQGQLHSPEIPTLRTTLRERLNSDLQTPVSPEDPLTMPLLNFGVTGALKRGIATFDEGVFTFDPSLGIDAAATIEGTLDLVLWIADITVDITAADEAMTPLALRIVGPPNQPQALFTTP